MTRCKLLAPVSLLFIALALSAQEPAVRILAPENGAIWVGQKEIAVEVENLASEKIRSVEFFLDGKLIREFKEPPFRLTHDFGMQPAYRRFRVIVYAVGGILLKGETASAQIDDAQVVKVTRVFIPVTVTDPDGNYISDRAKEDFSILEDGKEQPIVDMSLSSKTLVHLLLLIDISSSMKDKIAQVKEGAKSMLKNLIHRQNKGMVVFFNRDVFNEGNEFTSQTGDLNTFISAVIPFGATAMYDAINFCLRFLKPIPGRNIIVLFSDGQDNASFVDPYTLIKRVEKSNAQIYAIGSSQASTQDIQYHEILDSLAKSSGGLTHYLTDIGEVKQVYDKIQRDIDCTYVLQISSTDLGTPRYRRIEVKLKRGRYNVRSIQGYYN